MKNTLRKLLSKLLFAAVAITIVFGGTAHAALNLNLTSDQNWATTENRASLRGRVTCDICNISGLECIEEEDEFKNIICRVQPTQLVENYVPIEAKVGLAFMNALSQVATSLYKSLNPFIYAFIIIMFLFWVGFEVYNSMQGDNNVNKLVTGLVKKAVIVVIWLIILQSEPIKLFSYVMGPIISIGTFLADTILNASTAVSGMTLPDTCSAIHGYTASHIHTNVLTSDMAANILCIPTRLSGFCYNMVATGWELIARESPGVWNAIVDTCTGIALIIMFISVAWKFAFIALGVILDLFLGLIMLPFTALAETIGTTSLQAIPGQVYNAFTSVFKPEKLSDQINRLVNALIYFVSLSIVVGFCTALIGSVFTDSSTGEITLTSHGFWIAFIVTMLVWYFASQAESIAKQLGGSVNDSIGTALRGDVNKIWNSKPISKAKEWTAGQAWRGTKYTAKGAATLVGKGLSGIGRIFRR